MTSNLPNDTQRKLFSPERMQSFITQVLNGNIKGLHSRKNHKPIFRGNEEHDNKFNSSRLQTTSILVLEAIRVYEEYRENHLPPTDENLEAIAKLKDGQKRCSQLGTTRVKKRVTVKYNLLQEKKEGSD